MVFRAKVLCAGVDVLSCLISTSNARILYNLPNVTFNTRKSSLYIAFGALGVAVALGIFGIAILTEAPRIEAEIIGSDDGFADDNATTNQKPIMDVVVMQCGAYGEGQPSTVPIVVLAYSNSTNAPFYPFGTNCAQVLSDLMTDDFSITNVQPGDSDGGAFYTMVRWRYVDVD